MKKSILFMFHLLFWVFSSLFIVLVFQLLNIMTAVLGAQMPNFQETIKVLLWTVPIGACLFYISYFTLNFFIKRPIRFIWIGLLYVLLIPFLIIIEYHDSGNVDFLEILILLLPITYFNLFGFLFKTFIEWIKDRKIKAELEKDKITSQLELLKSQINPHLLFNSLNNIDVLIHDEPQKASEYLKKLSEILRFMLYESNTDRIPLTEEIEYIRKYIDLQKIRTSNDSFVKFEISGNASGKYIAPMIFIHFIENAFKHSTNKKIENAVSIRFEISEKKLLFFCKNHYKTMDDTKSDKNGLGIKLIKQKLDLIYKNSYNLNVEEEDNWYIVNLEI